MLGEGARNAADAEKYFNAYAAAITAIGASAGNAPLPARPGISVKLTAFIRASRPSRASACWRNCRTRDRTPRLAKARELAFTIDAEEADRLELSLERHRGRARRPVARRLGRSGLRCRPIRTRSGGDRLGRTGGRLFGSRLTVRLVKGATGTPKIKRAQERGLADYPVFTRKAMTDLCYMACARTLLGARARIFPNSPPITRSPSPA